MVVVPPDSHSCPGHNMDPSVSYLPRTYSLHPQPQWELLYKNFTLDDSTLKRSKHALAQESFPNLTLSMITVSQPAQEVIACTRKLTCSARVGGTLTASNASGGGDGAFGDRCSTANNDTRESKVLTNYNFTQTNKEEVGLYSRKLSHAIITLCEPKHE